MIIARERTDLEEPVIPRLVPEPLWCAGTKKPVCCLDGEWEVRDYQEDTIQRIQVPFDMTVLRKKSGFSAHYEYRKKIKLPPMQENSRVVLKFEGVNGFASVYVDDVFITSHKNGFLTWNVEITEQVKHREAVMLRVVLDEETDQVSAYSHGGILHSVFLYMLPEVYINAQYLSPLFNEDMDTCTLRVDMDLARPACDGTFLEKTAVWEAVFRLTGPDGEKAAVKKVRLSVREDGYYTFSLPVLKPVLWDAEHPALYTLRTELYKNGERLECMERKTGLRRLERKGNRLFVNGQEIKLRGACRHEIAPRTGRALTKEIIEKDVALFQEANCNYIRTSHYPPSEYFLELCDEKGIYVEDELALAFIARTLPYTQQDPEQTQRYLSHFTECLARDYNHPSVIIWSLCNESFGGCNFDLLNRYAHRKDPTRMTKFSYPMTLREEYEMPDIWSIHYSEYNTDLSKKRDNVSVGHAPGRDMPVLHDEYVHVACYNREELRRDPSVRSFWGEGIRRFWNNIWNTEGALGGAIWAGIDETDIYDGGNTQLEWGIIDVWRRKKPEFYMTRKAYSPVRILHYQKDIPENRILLVAENRFCHTNFSEVKAVWKCGEYSGRVSLPAAWPGQAVKIIIRPENGRLSPEEDVAIAFLDACGRQVDEMMIAAQHRLLPDLPERDEKEKIRVFRLDKETALAGNGFVMAFDKETGLLSGLWLCASVSQQDFSDGRKRVSDCGFEKKRLLLGGPFLNVPYLKLGEWYLRSQSLKEAGGDIEVIIRGGYRDSLELTWRLRICPDGSFTVGYTIERLEKMLPGQMKLRVGVDCGGLDERGIGFLADPSMDMLSWRRHVDSDREGSYTWYPPDHIARNEGSARRFSRENMWGRPPVTSWAEDMRDDILNGLYDVGYRGTNDFKSTKENLAECCLCRGKDGNGIGIVSESVYREDKQGEAGSQKGDPVNVRLEIADPKEWKIEDQDPRIHYTGTWYKVEDKKESDHGTEMWSREKGAAAECTFTGTGIIWYGPQDTTYGMADVFIDGKPAAEKISQRVAGVDFSCSSPGYDKKYGLPIFSVTDLPMDKHTIRIEVCGEKAEDASDTYIVIDYLRILNGEQVEPVRLLVNQEFSYPHLSWGNYRKPPILMEEGTTGSVRMKVVSEFCPPIACNDPVDMIVRETESSYGKGEEQ